MLALGERLDRVEDLHVTRAAAQMSTEMATGLLLGQRLALLVDQRLRSHDDAGGAEAALQSAAGGEGVGVAIHLTGVEPLDRVDRLPGDPVERHRARHDGLAVDEHGAAPTLALRGTAVLGRREAEFLTDRREKVGMACGHGGRGSVDRERYSISVGGVGAHGVSGVRPSTRQRRTKLGGGVVRNGRRFDDPLL